LADKRLAAALQTLREITYPAEVCILSTCNRTEVYVATDNLETLQPGLRRALAGLARAEETALRPYLYEHTDKAAVRHLFRVASGIDSMVIGESEILAQVKEAFQIAERCGTTGPVLRSLFQHAVRWGKRARAETDIGRGALSVASLAVRLAKAVFGDLRGRLALVLGAGQTGESVLRHLVAEGVSTVVVANRTYERAVALARDFKGAAVRFEEFPQQLVRADIVIGSTAAPHPVITKEQVRRAMAARKQRPLFLIDIAVPRDVEATVNDLHNVFLYDIDDLERLVQDNAAQRAREVSKVEQILEQGLEQFCGWLNGRSAVPLIVSLTERAEAIRAREVRRMLEKAGPLNDRQREQVETLSRRLVNKMLAAPLAEIRRLAAAEQDPGSLDLVRRLFGLGQAPPADEEEE